MATGILADLSFFLTVALVGEFVVFLSIKKDEGGYKFRFSKWRGENNLEPYQKVIMVSIVALSLLIGVWFFSNYIFRSAIFDWVYSFTALSAFLYDIAVGSAIILIGTYYSREKSIDSYFWYMFGLALAAALIWGQLTFGFL